MIFSFTSFKSSGFLIRYDILKKNIFPLYLQSFGMLIFPIFFHDKERR